MGNWNQILNEINAAAGQHDQVRRQYLAKLFDLTGRNVVCYYSGWLQKTGDQFFNITQITDEDKAGFMSCFHGLDRNLGLDLLVHSPGGYVSATESLIHYIRSMFGEDIRVFVPQLAMSGGTLLALIGREIWMGKHSNLGPVDPQFGDIPAVTLLDEFRRAFDDITKQPNMIQVWTPILSKIAPTLITRAEQAISLSRDIAQNTLTEGMFKDQPKSAERVAKELTNVATHKEHNRHIHADDLRAMDLVIRDLESDDDLQDAILSVHHAFMISLSNTTTTKIVENHLGVAFMKHVAPPVNG